LLIRRLSPQVDLHVPVLSSQPVPETKPIDDNRLKAIRRYISEARAAAKSLSIPDDVAEHIQSEFVRLRKKATEEGKNVGEEELKRWMKIAR
jgi:DNA replicative helicase MCM subunit Mcm2 (Cdc46/Mcm family)